VDYRAFLRIGNIAEAFRLYGKIWCWKRQQPDVKETDPSGNSGCIAVVREKKYARYLAGRIKLVGGTGAARGP